MTKKLSPFWAVSAIVIGAVLVFCLYIPVWHMLRKSVFLPSGFSLELFGLLFQNSAMVGMLANSMAIGVIVTLLCVAISLPLGWFSTRYRLPGQGILNGLLLLPMILPPFVGAIGMKQFLARFGVLNLALTKLGIVHEPIDWLGTGFWGVVVLEVLHLFPIVYLNLTASLANINPAYEEAAWNLGSSSARFIRKILLPLAAPGLFAGCAIVFVWSITDLGTPLILDYRNVVAYQVYGMITDTNENAMGYALVVLLLAWVAVIYFASKAVFLRGQRMSSVKGMRTAVKARPSPLVLTVALALFLGVAACAAVPHLMVLLSSVAERWFMTILPERLSFEYYRAVFEHPLTVMSMRNSVMLSSVATIADIVLGVLAAYLISRFRFKGRALLDFSVMLPLALPGLILAFGYVGTFAGTWLDPRINPFPLLIAAYGVRRLPFMVRSVDAGLQQVDPAMEEAAYSLGASPGRTLTRVTLPMISANVIAGAVFVFTFAMLEVSDSLILAMKEVHYPIAKAIYAMSSRIADGFPLASAMGVLAAILLATGLFAATKVLGRKMGEMFRM
jgi:iron(III) transport system permease protein